MEFLILEREGDVTKNSPYCLEDVILQAEPKHAWGINKRVINWKLRIEEGVLSVNWTICSINKMKKSKNRRTIGSNGPNSKKLKFKLYNRIIKNWLQTKRSKY